MARRMFSDEITTSDAFLDMPTESQTLYFHLGMSADDDGFISNTKMIQRVIGASDDSLKILFAKKFLLQFPNGICVVKHWRINNQIRKDRYTETKYVNEKSQLFIRANGAYTTNPDDAIKVPKGHFLPLGNQVATDGQPSIGKVSIGKDSKHTPPKADDVTIEPTDETEYAYDPLFLKFWPLYPKRVGKGAAYRAWKKIKPAPSQKLFDKIRLKLDVQRETPDWKKENGKYIPHPATYLNQRRWEDEVEISQKKVTQF